MSEEEEATPTERRSSALAPALWALAILAGAILLGMHLNGARVFISLPLLFTFGLDLLVGYVVFLILKDLQREGRVSYAISIAAPAGLLLASYVKLSTLGFAGSVHDIYLIQDLLIAAPDVQRWTAYVALAALSLVLAWNLAPKIPSLLTLAFAAALIGLPAAAIRNAEVARYASSVIPGRISNFPLHGHFLNAWIEVLEKASFQHTLANTDARVDFDLISAAPRDLRLAQRNIQFVLIESFADPLWFPAFTWPDEPLSPLFARWREVSDARSLSPTFGARSTNVEFEALCGIPAAVDGSTVIFLHIQPGQSLRCLPRILSEAGFRSLSVIAESPHFLNGPAARRALGFERLVFNTELDQSDRDGVWLSASATLEQAERFRREMSHGDDGGPVFSYVFITAGHFPYERNSTRRPDVFAQHLQDHPVVRAWANGAHYNAQAVEHFVAELRRSDPDALIVVLGDHAPVLGANFRGYEAGGRLASGDVTPPLRQGAMYETPLLVLDGDQPMRLGRLPTWQIPEIVLNILSGGEFCTRMRCASTRERRLRPFYDFAMLVDPESGGSALCDYGRADSGPSCERAVQEARALQAILARMLAGPN